MLNPITEKVIAQLSKVNLTSEDRNALIAILLDKLKVLPIKDTVTFDEQGTIFIQGKKLDPEQAIMLKEGVITLRDSTARQVINEQITFEAIKIGVHVGLNTDQIMFSKAALWIIQEENKLISKISQE